MSEREHPVVAFREGRVQAEAFPFERPERRGIGDAVFQDMPRHLSAAHFRIDHDGFQPVALADAEFGRDDPRFAADAFPVEQPLHLSARQVDQDAVVGVNPAQQVVGQPALPVGKHRFVAAAGQYGVAFEPVGADGVQRAEQSVEERGDVEVPLGVFEIGVGETRRVDAFEDDSRVGRKGWDRRVVVAVEAAVAQAVFGGDTAVDAQEPGQFVGRERRQPGGQFRGLAAVGGPGRAGRRDGTALRHRLGAGEEQLHGVRALSCGAGDAERFDARGDGLQLLFGDFFERRAGGVAVERVDHHLLRADFGDEPEPGRDFLFGGVVDGLSAALPAQEHRLQNHAAVEAFHRFDDAPHRVGRALRVVHPPHRRVERRIEFEDVVVHAQQGAADAVAVDLRGVGEHRDLRRGAQRVAQGDRVADDGFEIGVHGRFAVAGEGDHVGRRGVGHHAPQGGFELRAHVLAAVEASSARVLGIPAALAVDAVERAEFRGEREQVDSQRKAQPPRMHRAENNVVE